MTILDQLAAYARERTAADKAKLSLNELKSLTAALPGNGQAFYDAVSRPGISFICEIKKASPSKGIIDPVFDYRQIAREY